MLPVSMSCHFQHFIRLETKQGEVSNSQTAVLLCRLDAFKRLTCHSDEMLHAYEAAKGFWSALVLQYQQAGSRK